MGDNENKGFALIAEAEKKLKSSKTFLGGLFGGQNSQDEAMELYSRAGNAFKMGKKWPEAGNTFVTLAGHHTKMGNKHDAATNFVDAANCYKKTDPQEAANCLNKAVVIYTDMGRFSIAAKHLQNIAEIYENDVADLERAMQHYEQAADCFRIDESNSSANKCMLKVAQYAAQLENYERAIRIYEQVAKSALESSLLKYSAKEYFFRASLCHLCVDALNAQHAIQRYEEQYPAFADSRESKLIKSLLVHIEDQDIDAFTEEIKKYDSISRLEAWYTTLLLRVKKSLDTEDDLL
ncbi:alpha-soluble NSF attachment protein isoform X1 [Lepeophtheirus salmonis]|uniref:Soluble NSF attachment protein n=2 Tax=Lepeophtheirus salmonis TaxID=72036 RepID=D3PH46_LEPSM|nr:alpha-soluble NSF attachment protein-like isoform X1 [Lepeophtheirus salmonis]ADD37882.1 Soluble NSF attachment protein [Lepeophtheirus salmonis]